MGPKSNQTEVNVFDTVRDANNAVGIPVKYDATTGVGSFAGVLQYPHTGANAYPYSQGAAANQVSLTGAIDETEDTEASTYYIQSISSVTATPKSTTVAGNGTTSAVIKVLDDKGKPVAGATVGYLTGTDNPSTTGDDRVDHKAVGTTDANGEYEFKNLGADTYTLYADSDSTDGFSAGDKAATPFTVVSYAPAFSTISIVNVHERTNYDNNELADGDDFTIETRDQKGNLIADANGVQYRWVVDAAGTANDADTDWQNATMTAKPGVYAVPAPPATPDASYTLQARRPNVGGTGLTNATPVTVKASQAKVAFDEGTDANAPIEGSYTVTGVVKNADGGLGGRLVSISYGGAREDSRLAPQSEQPAGVTRTSDTTATVLTDADGKFSVKLVDPAGPVVVADNPEDATFTVTGVQETKDDATSLGVSGSLLVHWAPLADVSSIQIDVTKLIEDDAAPGKPVNLDITVRGKDGDTNSSNDPALQDYPVQVSVDKGFLSPDAGDDMDNLSLAAGHDKAGDLYGFYQSLGSDEAISTGDAKQAGIVAAIEKDAGFDDDGLVTMTVTVKAGGVTETKNITFDSRDSLNLTEASLDRAAGEPTGDVTVGDKVDFNLWAKDQFGNLIGDRTATISDDSTVADFSTDGDYNETRTDYTTSGTGVTAFSDAPAMQTLMATMTGVSVWTVDTDGTGTWDSKTVSVKSAPINWVAGPGVPAIVAVLKGHDNGAKDDKLKVSTDKVAEGATVKLYKINKNGKKVLVDEGTVNKYGNAKFVAADKNGNKVTKYVAKVLKTAANKAAKTNVKKVR